MKENDGSVRSLEKAILLLELLSEETNDVDLATLAKKADLPKSTALRLLVTLKKHNLVQQDETSRRFNLGWSLISLGKAAEKSFSLIKLCHTYLEELVFLTSESASLSIMQGDHLVYIDQILSKNMIKGIPSIGSTLDTYCSSSGKAFLSTYPLDVQEKFIKKIKFERKTDHTIVDADKFREELKKSAHNGYAIDDEETEIGGRCVAAAIFNSEGKAVASMSIVGPTSRISRSDFPKFGTIISDIAGKASGALGYRA